MKVITVVGLLITSLVGLSVFNHYRVLGQFNANYLLVMLFLCLNMVICLWEICLWVRSDHIARRNEEFSQRFRSARRLYVPLPARQRDRHLRSVLLLPGVLLHGRVLVLVHQRRAPTADQLQGEHDLHRRH